MAFDDVEDVEMVDDQFRPQSREDGRGIWEALRTLHLGGGAEDLVHNGDADDSAQVDGEGKRPEERLRLVVGLGNPGPEHAQNRHNVGFRCVDRLSRRDGTFSWKRLHQALVAEGMIADQPVVLAKPQTYMNLSGRSVRPLLRQYGVDLEDLLVVHDDLDLLPGVLRLRRRGSSGGHRGLQSIVDALGSQAFPRLRVGIGRPTRGDPVDYVLGDFTLDESIDAERACDRAVAAIACWLTEGIEAAMNGHNKAPASPQL